MSPNTTPMLPSVNAQKPELICPSEASVEVTPTVMMGKNAAQLRLIQAGA